MKPFLLLLLFCNLVFLMWELGPREQQRQAQKNLLEQRLAAAPGLELLKPEMQNNTQPKTEEPETEKIVEPAPPSKPQPKIAPEPEKTVEPVPPSKPRPKIAPEPKKIVEPAQPSKPQPKIAPEPEPLPAPVASPNPVIGLLESDTQANLRCYDYGAFTTWDEAKAFTLQLPEGWVLGKIRPQDVWIDQGFWVMIPAPNTMKAARENLEQVKAKGVTDYWLVPTGRDRGIISLGLFNTIERAETQKQELRDKGIDAQINKKRVLRSRFRVGIQASSDVVSVLQAQGLTINPSLLDQRAGCPN